MTRAELPMFILLLLAGYLHALPVTSTMTSAVTDTPARASGGLQADEGPASGTEGDTTPFEMVGACRATCVEQTLQWPPSDDICLQDQDCLTCWQLCDLLYHDELKWRAMCSNADCTVGCTTACKFSFSTVIVPEKMPWEFLTAPVTTEVSESVLHVSWEAPRTPPRAKETTPQGRPYLVYTLLFKDDNTPHWSQVTSTLDHITQVDGQHATFPGLQFLVLASSPAGTMAHAVPPYPVVSSPAEPTPAPTPAPTRPQGPFVAHLAIQLLPTAEGAMEVEVTWQQAAWQDVTYVVTWKRLSCNVDETMPYCPLTQDVLSAHIKAKDREMMRVVLTQLTFNSEYAFSLSTERSEVILASNHFLTPACRRVDATFMTCRPPAAKAPAVPKPVTAAPVKREPVPTTSPVVTKTASTTPQRPVTRETRAPEEATTTRQPRAARYGAVRESGLSVHMLLVSAAVSLGSVILVLISFCVYKRWCSRPTELDYAKVMQSYAQLPLLGATTPNGSMGSLHQLHLHNVAARLLNGSNLSPFATPTHSQATPTHSYLTPTAHQLSAYTPSASQRWCSMDGLAPTGTSTPTGSRLSLFPGVAASHVLPPSSPAVPVITIDSEVSSSPFVRRQPPSHVHKARSVDGLDYDAPLPAASPLAAVPRAASASDGDLTKSSARPARRQIHFPDVPVEQCEEQYDDDDDLTVHEAAPLHRYLHTVPEEDVYDLEEDELRRTDMLEWEHEDLELPSFRARIETM